MCKPLMTKEQLEILRQNIDDMSYKDQQAFTREKFGIELTIAQCKAIRHHYKIYSKRNVQFKKGMVPFNKGKHIWKDGCPESMKRTQFQKGHIPHNARPIGYERIDEDGYILIKVEGKRKMIHKHRWVWEKANGAIPKGFKLVFMNGDRTDCRLENLKLISGTVNLIRNQNNLVKKDKELNEAGIQLSKLIEKQWERKKEWKKKSKKS